MTKLGSQKIGLIGVGNMGTSILEGVLKNRIASPSRIWVYDKIKTKAQKFARKTRVHWASSAAELFRKTDVILLAIKPQHFVLATAEHQKFLKRNHGVISILAGLTTDKMARAFGKKVALVRAMPNLGAKVGESMTVLCGKNKKWLSFAEKLFSGCGKVVRLPEKTFDLVTAISGSGPAYFFYLIELLTDFGIRRGLSKKIAETLAIETGVGATLLAKHSCGTHSAGGLRQMVTSKKGTTEAALKTLQRGKFKEVFQRALAAAVARSRELRK